MKLRSQDVITYVYLFSPFAGGLFFLATGFQPGLICLIDQIGQIDLFLCCRRRAVRAFMTIMTFMNRIVFRKGLWYAALQALSSLLSGLPVLIIHDEVPFAAVTTLAAVAEVHQELSYANTYEHNSFFL